MKPKWRNDDGRPGPWCACGQLLVLVHWGQVANSNITYGEWHCIAAGGPGTWGGCGRQWLEDDQSNEWSELT